MNKGGGSSISVFKGGSELKVRRGEWESQERLTNAIKTFRALALTCLNP